ncbi:hypothetical protein ACRRTK_022073 [Alexandromys fortis]
MSGQRGKGPLKHTTDVIYAAKMISESGSRMDVLARQIANQCPDPPCKQDLLAYLEQIKFYSHQLKICSQVKAEIQNLGGELIMSASGGLRGKGRGDNICELLHIPTLLSSDALAIVPSSVTSPADLPSTIEPILLQALILLIARTS